MSRQKSKRTAKLPSFLKLSTRRDGLFVICARLLHLRLGSFVLRHGDFHDVQRVVRINVGREFHVMAFMSLQYLRVLDSPNTLILVIDHYQSLAAFGALLNTGRIGSFRWVFGAGLI